MKFFGTILLTLTLHSTPLLAENHIKLYPDCYRGQMTVTTNQGLVETRSVLLSFSGQINQNIFVVNEFWLGQISQMESGQRVNENTLRFNSNNDYIPGGNSAFNRDIEVVFDKNGAVGTYELIDYPNSDGRGGFGQKRGILREHGQIQLKKCSYEIKDGFR